MTFGMFKDGRKFASDWIVLAWVIWVTPALSVREFTNFVSIMDQDTESITGMRMVV